VDMEDGPRQTEKFYTEGGQELQHARRQVSPITPKPLVWSHITALGVRDPLPTSSLEEPLQLRNARHCSLSSHPCNLWRHLLKEF